MFGRRWKRIDVDGLLLNASPYNVQFVFKNLSRCPKMLFKFSVIPILYHDSQYSIQIFHHDLFRILLLAHLFLSFTWRKSAAAGTITPISSSISSSFIFLFWRQISSISSTSYSHFFKHFLKKFGNHPSYF